jgi:hypothetical protein
LLYFYRKHHRFFWNTDINEKQLILSNCDLVDCVANNHNINARSDIHASFAAATINSCAIE